MNQINSTRIVTESIALAEGTNLVRRFSSRGEDMELHTAAGAFSIPPSEVKRIRAFLSDTELPAPRTKSRIPVVNQPDLAPTEAKRGGRKGKEEPAAAAAPVKRHTDPSKLAKRYTEAEKVELLTGFREAKSKNQFAKDHGMAIETLRRWNSVAK